MKIKKQLFKLLCLSLIILLSSLIFLSLKPKTKENLTLNNEWVVILTTCVTPTAFKDSNNMELLDSNKRKMEYENAIRKWMNETNLPIFVVENSGYTFNNLIEEFKDTNRLFVYSFNDTTDPTDSSIGEINTLKYCLEKMKETEEYKNCKYILKVTGKYFLKGIEKALEEAPKDKDLYLQKHRDINRRFQHTEYFGMKKNILNDFIEKNMITLNNVSIENYLYEYTEKNTNWTTIGTFTNYDKIKQSTKIVIEEL
jgi:hypothetical protein